MKKRIFSLLLTTLLLFCTVSMPTNAVALPFKDVSDNAYYYKPVSWALENGITSGTSATAFSPAATCTRGQVVTFLWRSQGQPEPSNTANIFSDVNSSDYYYKPILWAVEKGITNGTSATEFSPSSTCTRAQVLTFLWRAENQPSASGSSSLASAYKGQYFEKAVAWADTNGMLSNMGNTTFNANTDCPRSDIVTYLYRFTTGDTGSSSSGSNSGTSTTSPVSADSGKTYILNTSTHKFHKPGCSSIKQMSEKTSKHTQEQEMK